jgi:methylmalonyl-CoA mutase N-terminal domain/subunit
VGGSWAIESATERIVREARGYIERIDAMGGARAAIERGFQQHEIAEAAYATQRAIEKGEQVIVGVNRYGAGAETPPEILEIDPRGETEQVERLRAVRAGRNAERANESLDALRRDAIENANLMPAILDCVRAEVTLGEISNALREIYGEHRDSLAG